MSNSNRKANDRHSSENNEKNTGKIQEKKILK